MTQEQYNKSIETGELQLSLRDKSSHYGIVEFLLFIPLVFLSIILFYYFKGDPKPFVSAEIYIILFPVFLSMLFYLLLKKRLKFKVLHSELDHKDLTAHLIQLCKEQNWTISFHNANIFIAKTNISLTSWGERVTVLFNGNEILVNSISDPDGKPSLIAIGPNRDNVKAVIDLIENINYLDHKA